MPQASRLPQTKVPGQRLPGQRLPGAHLLDWNGQDQEVTFNPALFDEHPNTLTLLSFGSDLLAELLDSPWSRLPPEKRPGSWHDAGSRLPCLLSATSHQARTTSLSPS